MEGGGQPVRRAFGALSFEEEKAAFLDRTTRALEQRRHLDGSSIKKGPMSNEIYQEGQALQWEYSQSASTEVRDDKDVVLPLLELNPLMFEFCSPRIRADTEAVVAVVGPYPHLVQFASEELRGDKAAMLQVVKEHGLTVEFASKELRADKDVLLAALSSDGRAILYADEALLDDEDVVLASALREAKMPEHFDCLDGELEFERSARLGDDDDDDDVDCHARGLQCASLRLRQNKDFVLKAHRAGARTEEDEICWHEADDLLKQALPLDEFECAAESVLAHAGEAAPVLTISPPDKVPLDTNSSPICHVAWLSGQSFTFEAPKAYSDERALKMMTCSEFARALLEELSARAQVNPTPERLFLVIAGSADNAADSLMMTPWDWNRPLADFLPFLDHK